MSSKVTSLSILSNWTCSSWSVDGEHLMMSISASFFILLLRIANVAVTQAPMIIKVTRIPTMTKSIGILNKSSIMLWLFSTTRLFLLITTTVFLNYFHFKELKNFLWNPVKIWNPPSLKVFQKFSFAKVDNVIYCSGLVNLGDAPRP